MLVRLDGDGCVPNHVKDAGYEYFLAVTTTRDEALGEWNAQLNSSQRLAVVLYYAEHDAWPEWFNQFCQARKGGGA
jgi:hypothetical protein